ncbi:MAG: hypothetical protein CM15mP74_06720 [Halieaceae bacterium]|nr:MAG: hypothetical protein CM15mP74_06720 [Halieaceae bacterium]
MALTASRRFSPWWTAPQHQSIWRLLLSRRLLTRFLPLSVLSLGSGCVDHSANGGRRSPAGFISASMLTEIISCCVLSRASFSEAKSILISFVNLSPERSSPLMTQTFDHLIGTEPSDRRTRLRDETWRRAAVGLFAPA